MSASKAYQSAALLITVVMLLSSCSFLSRAGLSGERDARIASETAKQAQEQFALGRYKKALDVYSAAYDKYHTADLRRGYARLGEQTKAAADAWFQAGNFGEAGSAYRNLFESGITTRDFAQALSFDDDVLIRIIKTCSKSLMEIGLMRYREAKLEEAIAIWKKALAFDADNRNVRNAIDTATVQLQQLKTLR
jgi:tetratricopeptide (TPR) repeat protein